MGSSDLNRRKLLGLQIRVRASKVALLPETLALTQRPLDLRGDG